MNDAYTFQREPADRKLFDDLMPLLKLHFNEIAHYKDIPLDPDFEQYAKLEDIGALRAFTARTADGLLIGYSVFFVRHNIHYRSSLQASQDVLYVDPSRRGFGAKFILYCDKQLAQEGIQVVYQHIKAEHNFGPMLERLGYEQVDLIFGKRLDQVREE